MNWQEFEDNLKKRVDGHETPVDTDALWDKVRPRKRRRFLLFFWWLLGAGLLGGIGWGVVQGRKAALAGKNISGQEIVLSTDMESARNAENAPAPVVENTKRPGQPNAEKTETVPSETTNTASSNHLISAKKRTQNAGKGPEKPRNNHSITPLHPVQPPTPPNNPAVANPVLFRKDTVFARRNFSNPENMPVDPVPAGSEARTVLTPLDVIPGAVARQDTPSLELPQLDEFSLLPAPVYAVPKRRIQAGAYAGISMWNILHNGPGGSGIPRPQESLQESLQAGLFGQLPMGNRFVFRAGVQYLQFTSVFRWRKSSIVANQDETVLNYYIDGRVDTSYLPGAWMQVDRKVRHYNKLIYINLPLDLQYRIPLGRGAITPFAGVQPGISVYREGTVLGSNGLPDAAPFRGIYRRTFALSMRVGAGFEFPWRKRVFFIEPTGTLDMLPRTAQGRATVEQFWQAGVNVGMRW